MSYWLKAKYSSFKIPKSVTVHSLRNYKNRTNMSEKLPNFLYRAVPYNLGYKARGLYSDRARFWTPSKTTWLSLWNFNKYLGDLKFSCFRSCTYVSLSECLKTFDSKFFPIQTSHLNEFRSSLPIPCRFKSFSQ